MCEMDDDAPPCVRRNDEHTCPPVGHAVLHVSCVPPKMAQRPVKCEVVTVLVEPFRRLFAELVTDEATLVTDSHSPTAPIPSSTQACAPSASAAPQCSHTGESLALSGAEHA